MRLPEPLTGSVLAPAGPVPVELPRQYPAVGVGVLLQARQSGIAGAGVGLFNIGAPIPAGAFVLEYGGRLVRESDYHGAAAAESPYIIGFHVNSRRFALNPCRSAHGVNLDTQPLLSAGSRLLRYGLGSLINHSRGNPNLQPSVVSSLLHVPSVIPADGPAGAAGAPPTQPPLPRASMPPSLQAAIHTYPRLIFRATREIATGDELLFDYGDRDQQSVQDNAWLAH